jgi:hypothetical protein
MIYICEYSVYKSNINFYKYKIYKNKILVGIYKYKRICHFTFVNNEKHAISFYCCISIHYVISLY